MTDASEVKQKFEEGLNTIRALTGLTQADFDTLKEAAPQAAEWVDELVKLFYDTLFAHPRTASIFREGERAEREKTLRNWVLHIFTEANDNDEFWKEQARIAFAHIRRHVTNEIMVGIAVKTLEFIHGKVIEAFGPEKGSQVAISFARVLFSIVGLTAYGYDAMSTLAFVESTGADADLTDMLIQQSVNTIQDMLLGE